MLKKIKIIKDIKCVKYYNVQAIKIVYIYIYIYN